MATMLQMKAEGQAIIRKMDADRLIAPETTLDDLQEWIDRCVEEMGEDVSPQFVTASTFFPMVEEIRKRTVRSQVLGIMEPYFWALDEMARARGEVATPPEPAAEPEAPAEPEEPTPEPVDEAAEFAADEAAAEAAAKLDNSEEGPRCRVCGHGEDGDHEAAYGHAFEAELLP